jgi:hypothetical protein
LLSETGPIGPHVHETEKSKGIAFTSGCGSAKREAEIGHLVFIAHGVELITNRKLPLRRGPGRGRMTPLMLDAEFADGPAKFNNDGMQMIGTFLRTACFALGGCRALAVAANI